eukprot:906655_1
MYSVDVTGGLSELSIANSANTTEPVHIEGGRDLYMQYEFVFGITKGKTYVLKAENIVGKCFGTKSTCSMYFGIRYYEFLKDQELTCSGKAEPQTFHFSLINLDHAKFIFNSGENTQATLYVNWMGEVGNVKVFHNSNRNPTETLSSGKTFFDLDLENNTKYTFQITGASGTRRKSPQMAGITACRGLSGPPMIPVPDKEVMSTNPCLFDVGICIDRSRSVKTEFGNEIQFFRSFLQRLNNQKSSTLRSFGIGHIGKKTDMNDDFFVKFQEGNFTNMEEAIMTSAGKIRFSFGTNIASCLEAMMNSHTQMVDREKLSTKVKKLMIVLTDGKSTHGRKRLPEVIKRMQNEKYLSFAIGFQNADQSELENIAIKNRVFVKPTIQDISKLLDTLTNNFCVRMSSCVNEPILNSNGCVGTNYGSDCTVKCVSDHYKLSGGDIAHCDDGVWTFPKGNPKCNQIIPLGTKILTVLNDNKLAFSIVAAVFAVIALFILLWFLIAHFKPAAPGDQIQDVIHDEHVDRRANDVAVVIDPVIEIPGFVLEIQNDAPRNSDVAIEM